MNKAEINLGNMQLTVTEQQRLEVLIAKFKPLFVIYQGEVFGDNPSHKVSSPAYRCADGGIYLFSYFGRIVHDEIMAL